MREQLGRCEYRHIIPYSKIDGGAFEVPYDSLEDLYPEMINDLSDAIRTLEGMRETVSSDLAQYDILFGGDFGKWLQFANSLKFRMAVRMSSMDVDFAKTAMQEAMTSGMLLDNADNAALPTSDNPIFKLEQWGAAIGDYLSVQAPGQVTYQDPLTSVNGNLTLPAVSWDAYSNENDHLWQILTQKYIANFMIGLESWCDFRRTGYPVMFASVRDMGNIGSRQMRRLPYPESERANNTANYQQAVAENFGGRDEATVDLAWAKKD